MSSPRKGISSIPVLAVMALACLGVAVCDLPRSSAARDQTTITPTVPGLPGPSAVPAQGNTIAPADSQRILERFARIRRSSSVTIFQVDGWYSNCRPWTFPRERVVDCHPIVQEVPAPSKAWRDSLIALLTSPGALVPPRPNLCQCWDDVVLRFEWESETTTVWLCTGCATVGIPTPTAVLGFDFAPGPSKLRWLVNSALPPIKYETRLHFEYYDTPPILIATPEIPRRLRADPAARPDTVAFEARIGKDGRVSQLELMRGDQRLADLVAPYVDQYVYRPALSGGRPVASMIWVSVPVPKGAR